MATNVAAIGYLARNSHSRALQLLAGLLYALGRALAYTLVGALITWGMLSAPVLSNFLQKHLGQLMGPLLVLVGMILLGLLPGLPSFGGSGKLGKRVADLGVIGSGLARLPVCPGLLPGLGGPVFRQPAAAGREAGIHLAAAGRLWHWLRPAGAGLRHPAHRGPAVRHAKPSAASSNATAGCCPPPAGCSSPSASTSSSVRSVAWTCLRAARAKHTATKIGRLRTSPASRIGQPFPASSRTRPAKREKSRCSGMTHEPALSTRKPVGALASTVHVELPWSNSCQSPGPDFSRAWLIWA